LKKRELDVAKESRKAVIKAIMKFSTKSVEKMWKNI